MQSLTNTKKEAQIILQLKSQTPFSKQAIFQRNLDWLVKMAKTPGWKGYAWKRAKDLETEEAFKGICKQLTEKMDDKADMNRIKNEQTI